ncbi:glycoside hydrolase family 30 protein, partial [Bifidobacterium mongoliense]|uniref:glycoside hydrolase family 30 protein n=1 Tax=Bifidobacterium mongoliense TaxID=518643 RepID=UPI003F5160E2
NISLPLSTALNAMSADPASSMKLWCTRAAPDDSGLLDTMTERSVADAAVRDTAAEHRSALPCIHVDPSRRRQRIDGFGASITEACAWLWSNRVRDREGMIRAVFDPHDGIGLSLLRQPIGPSDHVTAPYRFLRRLPDRRLHSLDFGEEDRRILPMVLAAARAVAGGDTGRMAAGVAPVFESAEGERGHGPHPTESSPAEPRLTEPRPTHQRLRIIASAWSAPWWMKTNGSVLGQWRAWPHVQGYLRRSCYDAYARYLTAFCVHYRDCGLDVFGLTPVNEPDNAQSIWPSMAMTPAQQARFVSRYLAPRLREANLDGIRVMGWDHNYATPRYPDGGFVRSLYADERAKAALAGSAWHYYGGDPATMTAIHRYWPDHGIWVTEASGGEWGPKLWRDALLTMGRRIVAMLNHWAQAVILWNVALDERGGPDYYYRNSAEGHSLNRGLLTVLDDGTWRANADYYALGHCSRFVPAGSFVVETRDDDREGVPPHVAFVTPTDRRVLVMVNDRAGARDVVVEEAGRRWVVNLPPYSLSTAVWSGA